MEAANMWTAFQKLKKSAKAEGKAEERPRKVQKELQLNYHIILNNLIQIHRR